MTFNEVITTTKKTIAGNLPFLILIIALLTISVVRALPENHIDMPSATALLGARWWARDGFLKHYFLELNAGYGKIVRYFDEPALSEHAQGAVAGGLIGHKLYNPHYPSLHGITSALLMKFGIDSLFILRLPSIFFSILSLILLYIFIKLLSNRHIALIAVTYFGISPIFIKFADSLEYTPLEDLWRSLILLLSLLALRRLKFWYLLVIWISYLILAFISYNSTFFIFTWLIGISAIYIYHSGHRHKICLFLVVSLIWALAPILAFGVRLTQSVAYLGWRNTWLDIYGAFIWAGNRPGLGLKTRIDALTRPFFSITGLYNFYILIISLGITKIKYFIILIFLITALIAAKLMKVMKYKITPLPVLTILAIAPLTQTLIMPFIGFRETMGRLFAPFVGIIIGTVTYVLLRFYKNGTKTLRLFDKISFGFLFIVLASLFTIQIILNNTTRFWSYAPLPNSSITFSKNMQTIAGGEKAVFMINSDDTKIPEEEFKKRASIYNPAHVQTNYIIWKYYLDMPLLNFASTSYLIRDLLYLEKRTEFPFTAVITSDDGKIINELHENLAGKKLPLSKVKLLNNRYFFTVSPILKKDF